LGNNCKKGDVRFESGQLNLLRVSKSTVLFSKTSRNQSLFTVRIPRCYLLRSFVFLFPQPSGLEGRTLLSWPLCTGRRLRKHIYFSFYNKERIGLHSFDGRIGEWRTGKKMAAS